MNEKNPLIKQAAYNSLLSIIFAFMAAVKDGLVKMTSLLGKIAYPFWFFLNVLDLIDALFKTYQDIRDWFLIRKRAKEEGKTVQEIIGQWNLSNNPLDKQRAARAKELVGPWNIGRNFLTHSLTIALKLLAVIACLSIITMACFGIVGILPLVTTICFAAALSLGALICGIKIIDAIHKLTKKDGGENKKAATLKLISSLSIGIFCLIAAASTIASIFISGPIAGAALMLVGSAAAASMTIVLFITYLISTKMISLHNAVEQNPSAKSSSEKQSLRTKLRNKSYKKLISLNIQITLDHGLFWKKNGEYTRDKLEIKKIELAHKPLLPTERKKPKQPTPPFIRNCCLALRHLIPGFRSSESSTPLLKSDPTTPSEIQENSQENKKNP